MIEPNALYEMGGARSPEPWQNEQGSLRAEQRQQNWLRLERDEQDYLRSKQEILAPGRDSHVQHHPHLYKKR